MDSLFQNWEGSIEINGSLYSDKSAIPKSLTLDSNSIIILHTNKKSSETEEAKASDKEYQVTVRQYMTKPATPSFDFMDKWNNGNPMPLRTMVGTILKETSGMYKMKLRGDIIGERIQVCMKCGKSITNPVSQYFGMGPECGQHNYINPFESDEELKLAVDEYKKQLRNITWEGWIIKSAITNMEEI